jgi:1,4-alpha-glucan branching enzyme
MEETDRQEGVVLHGGGWRFSVWAPNASAVFVTGTFNGWSKTAHPLARQSGGWWSAEVAEAGPGDQYRFRILSGDREFSRIDPYARRVTSSVGNAVIPRPVGRERGSRFSPPALNEMVIYELHIGTFGRKVEAGPSDLEGALERLPYLKDLGVNAVEIMPFAEFPGGYSWGYNPSQIFAVESDYGTPRTFRDFVDAAHHLGIAVIVDVVYNHFGPSDLDLWQFDGWSENDKGGIYFYNDWRAQTPWGETRPDYGRPEVRQYIRDNALMWIRDYDVDGLRWDATAYIRNVHGLNNDPGSDLPDGWKLMQWVNQEIKKVKPTAFAIAEDLRDNPFIVKGAEDGGAGFDSQWDTRFVHPVRKALVIPDDTSRNVAEVRDAIVHRFYLDAFERVVYTESHDEVANGRARVPEELDPGKASSWIARKRSTLGAALVFTAPGLPMIFQGQEFLEDDWFHDEDPIDWSKKDRFPGILCLYKDLIRLRLNREGMTRGLCGQEVSVYHINHEQKMIAFHRWDRNGAGDSVVIVANLANRLQEAYSLGMPATGSWLVRLNSDSSIYDPEFGNAGVAETLAIDTPQDGLPAKTAVTIAPYSVLILSQNRV